MLVDNLLAVPKIHSRGMLIVIELHLLELSESSLAFIDER